MNLAPASPSFHCPARRRWWLLAACLALLSGCASEAGRGVIIDRQGVDMAQYQRDLEECTAYAEEVRAAQKVAANAAGGAVVGGAVGGVSRGSSGAADGAKVGAVVGGARGTRSAWREQQQVVRNCLQGRGYRVLNR